MAQRWFRFYFRRGTISVLFVCCLPSFLAQTLRMAPPAATSRFLCTLCDSVEEQRTSLAPTSLNMMGANRRACDAVRRSNGKGRALHTNEPREVVGRSNHPWWYFRFTDPTNLLPRGPVSAPELFSMHCYWVGCNVTMNFTLAAGPRPPNPATPPNLPHLRWARIRRAVILVSVPFRFLKELITNQSSGVQSNSGATDG